MTVGECWEPKREDHIWRVLVIGKDSRFYPESYKETLKSMKEATYILF